MLTFACKLHSSPGSVSCCLWKMRLQLEVDRQRLHCRANGNAAKSDAKLRRRTIRRERPFRDLCFPCLGSARWAWMWDMGIGFREIIFAAALSLSTLSLLSLSALVVLQARRSVPERIEETRSGRRSGQGRIPRVTRAEDIITPPPRRRPPPPSHLPPRGRASPRHRQPAWERAS